EPHAGTGVRRRRPLYADRSPCAPTLHAAAPLYSIPDRTMYQAGSFAELLRSRRAGQRAAWVVGRNVLFLGLTSLVTDVSSEMISAVLPLYVVYSLDLSPLHLGVIDGLYQGVGALVRVLAGVFADRWRRLKEVAGFGYALSAICKLGLVAIGSSAPALAGLVVVDRTGKGLRTAPRD